MNTVRVIYRRNGNTIKDETREITKEERERLEADYRRTHPPDVERISGCCDPPEKQP